MTQTPILTVAVPTFNMEDFLAQNLQSMIIDERDKIEVLVLDNSSTDHSGDIADTFAKEYPQTFTVIHKENNGYGSSINLAVKRAKGKYLRIVDADDWVDTQELRLLLRDMETCTADLVECDYTTIDISTGTNRRINMCPVALGEGALFHPGEGGSPFPTMHSTIFRIDFLRENHISLLENTFYVDEQLMILAVIHAHSAVYYKRNVYQYRIGLSTQSISVENMGQRYQDRERVIKNCLASYGAKKAIDDNCLAQIAKNVGNHFTTLYMYVRPTAAGRVEAHRWERYLKTKWPDIYKRVARKRIILALLNRAHIYGETYIFFRNIFVNEREKKDRG